MLSLILRSSLTHCLLLLMLLSFTSSSIVIWPFFLTTVTLMRTKIVVLRMALRCRCTPGLLLKTVLKLRRLMEPRVWRRVCCLLLVVTTLMAMVVVVVALMMVGVD